ncbi:MAG: DNA-directed RNA polymerase subunit omega [Nitrospinae bacterium]|nr:DNA-directed RNA polymerase subunit omega [Nitrospinota bacterium]
MFNTELYAAAAAKIPEKYLLTNLVSMRARQIQDRTSDPMIDPTDLSPIDIALKEIAEGLLTHQWGEEEAEKSDAEKLFG